MTVQVKVDFGPAVTGLPIILHAGTQEFERVPHGQLEDMQFSVVHASLWLCIDTMISRSIFYA